MAKRSSSNWINPSFGQCSSSAGDDDVFSSPDAKRIASNSSKKTKRNYSNLKYRKIKQDPDTSWVLKYAPKMKDELAVHKKKISEVEEWLKKNFQSCVPYQHPGILLLTGPSGVGKTTTLNALANELSFEVQEWSSTPCESMPYNSYINGVRQWNDAHDIMCQSQNTIFSNFLLRVNKYPSLFTAMSRRAILVEEFPNVYLKDPTVFHNLLRKFHKTLKCPAIFIVSDSTSSVSLENHLFPKHLQTELNITNISFNPVAPTMMVKALNRICAIVRDSSISESLPDKTNVEEIASNSMGDIRGAVNALQFFSIQKKSLSQTGTGLKRKMSGSQPEVKLKQMSSNRRDSSLFLFHALGKILHCKRDNTLKPDHEKLPYHLSHLERNPLVSNPEEVFENTSVSAENFALFLHENYLAFVNNVDIAKDCSTYLSDADMISIEWMGRDVLRDYTASVAARGLMFNLAPMAAGHRWRAIHKPQYFSTLKENRNLTSCLGNMFKDTRLSLKELKTELLPYLFKIGTSSLNMEESRMVHQIGRMTVSKYFRCQGESLNEKDLIKEETQSQVEISAPKVSKSLIKTDVDIPNSESEEEITIEEYNF